jgi:hypothetical protein
MSPMIAAPVPAHGSKRWGMEWRGQGVKGKGEGLMELIAGLALGVDGHGGDRVVEKEALEEEAALFPTASGGGVNAVASVGVFVDVDPVAMV